jgi:hypothetical protein
MGQKQQVVCCIASRLRLTSSRVLVLPTGRDQTIAAYLPALNGTVLCSFNCDVQVTHSPSPWTPVRVGSHSHAKSTSRHTNIDRFIHSRFLSSARSQPLQNSTTTVRSLVSALEPSPPRTSHLVDRRGTSRLPSRLISFFLPASPKSTHLPPIALLITSSGPTRVAGWKPFPPLPFGRSVLALA